MPLKKNRLKEEYLKTAKEVLEAPKGLATIDVEITMLSSKPNEKRGKAKLMIHKPNIKKGETIQASM